MLCFDTSALAAGRSLLDRDRRQEVPTGWQETFHDGTDAAPDTQYPVELRSWQHNQAASVLAIFFCRSRKNACPARRDRDRRQRWASDWDRGAACKSS